MREIKFRAHYQKVSNDVWMVEGEYTIKDLTDRGIRFDQVRIKWVQYTGLRDKNGKEIYEGDIVSYPVILTPTRKDHYKHGLVKWGDIHCWMIDDEMLGEYSSEELEVIGSIYESPALLGGK